MKSRLVMFAAICLAAAALGAAAGRLIGLVPASRRRYTRPWPPN